MPTVPMNPISKKIDRLIKEGKVTLEQIAVLTGISYPTLKNIFHYERRDRLSRTTFTIFKHELKFLTKEDIKEYEEWIKSRPLKRPGRQRRSIQKKIGKARAKEVKRRSDFIDLDEAENIKREDYAQDTKNSIDQYSEQAEAN